MFGVFPNIEINHSSIAALCSKVLMEAMDKSILFCLANSRATFIEVRDMLNAKFIASLLLAW